MAVVLVTDFVDQDQRAIVVFDKEWDVENFYIADVRDNSIDKYTDFPHATWDGVDGTINIRRWWGLLSGHGLIELDKALEIEGMQYIGKKGTEDALNAANVLRLLLQRYYHGL